MRIGAILILVVTVLAPVLSFAEPRLATAATPPNIVIIMADDMDARMVDDLPRLQEFFSERGLSFSSFYAAAPQCCPSRASFLRGQYPHNTGVLQNSPPNGGSGAFRNNGNEASTIATWMSDAGYRTGLVGKYLNDYEKSPKHVPPGWNRWFVYTGKGKYTTYTISDQGKPRVYGKKKQSKHYQTDVLTNKALEFINSTGDETPLFLFLAPSAPHEPATPAQRHQKASVAQDGAPRVPSFNEEDNSDKAGLWRGRGQMSGKKIKDVDRFYTRQLKAMFAVEEMIEKVVDALAAQNRLDNTYLIFTSDNGVHHGEHRIPDGKKTSFEESIRVPLIVVGPGVPAGATTDAMSSNIDLGATFAELAGAAAPGFVDGRSLAPVLDGNPPGNWREAVISEFLIGPGGGFVVLRSGPYALVEFGNGERELYDLDDDPYQLDNLITSAPQGLIDDLQAQLDALAACGDDGPTTCQAVDLGG